MRWALVLVLVMAGCTADSALLPPGLTPSFDPRDLFLTAWPGQPTYDDGSVRAMPVQFASPPIDETLVVDLPVPLTVEGAVTGTNTMRALPGVDGPVPATLYFDRNDDGTRQITSTDASGTYSIAVVEGEHTITVVPHNPLLPVWRTVRTLSAPDFNGAIHLEPTIPIWGRLTEGGEPLADAPVRLVTDDGIEGPRTHTDDDGWYRLWVTERLRFRVRLFDADDGTRPMVFSEEHTASPEGARIDFALPAPERSLLTMRVVEPDGNSARQLPYRLRSLSLAGYENGILVQTGFTDNRGNLVTQLLHGRYLLELLPERELSGRSLQIDVRGPTEAALVTLEAFVILDGSVRAWEAPVAGARVGCTEIGLAQRSWSADTDEDGRFELAVPRAELRCVVLPPAGATLAADRFFLVPTELPPPGERTELVRTLEEGAPVYGQVRFRAQPEPWALVELHDANGALLATDLTDESGWFEMRVVR